MSRPHIDAKTASDLVILIVATGFVFIGLGFTNGFFDKQLTQNFDFDSPDRDDKERLYHGNLVMIAKSFSAGEPIFVETTLNVTNNYPEPKYAYVTFGAGTHLYPKIPTGFGKSAVGGIINATLQPSGNYYGNATITFDRGGCFIVEVSSNPPQKISQSGYVEITCNLIQIDSSEANSTFYTNKLIIGLTYAGLGVAFLSIRSIIREILNDYPLRHGQQEPQ